MYRVFVSFVGLELHPHLLQVLPCRPLCGVFVGLEIEGIAFQGFDDHHIIIGIDLLPREDAAVGKGPLKDTLEWTAESVMAHQK